MKDTLLEWADWAEQYRSELYKQSAERSALIEGLLFAGDYEAIQDWLKQWESEDAAPDSSTQKYKHALSQLQSHRKNLVEILGHDYS